MSGDASAPIKRVATCHPDRPMLARGLCGTCYHRGWRARFQEQVPDDGSVYNRIGVIGLGEGYPAPIAGVEQRAVVAGELPTRCPKCGNAHLVTVGRCVSCPGYLAGCGWDSFVVAGSATLSR